MLGLDCETTGLDFHHGSKPFLVTTCNDQDDQVWWEWDVDPTNREPVYQYEDLEEIQQVIDDADWLVLQNPTFDVAALQVTFCGRLRWDWAKVYDTLLAGHLLASNQPHDLASMCLQYLRKDISKYEDRIRVETKKARSLAKHHPGWRIAKADLPEMPRAKTTTWKYDMWLCRVVDPDSTVCADYANMDSAVLIPIFERQRAELESRGLWHIYLERLKILPIVYDMERKGITLSKARLEKLRRDYVEEAGRRGRVCINIAKKFGCDLTLPKSGNNKSLLATVFDGIGLPVVKRSKKTSNPSLDKQVLEEYEATLPERSRELCFVKSLRAKRSRDTAVNYLDGYTRFWKPLEPSSGWYVLYPSLNSTGTDTLRWSSSNPNSQNICCDGETEVLTRGGWVSLKALVAGVPIAQYWSETDDINFVMPEICNSSFVGFLHHIRTHKHIDMLVTPKHRCFLVARKTGICRDVAAEDFHDGYKHYHAGYYVGGENFLIEDEVIWICAVQADGSYHEGGGIRFDFKKYRKLARLRGCLDRLGAKYSESDGRFYIGKHEPVVKMVRLLMPDKMFGPWLLDLTQRTLELFADEIFHWDGDYTRKNSWSSSDLKSAEWVQVLLSLTGSRSRIVRYTPSSAWAVRDHYRVDVTCGQPWSVTDNFTRELVEHDGPVYCVTVPSTYIVVRRNGKVSITGNSKKEAFNLRYCFGPAPGREWWSLDANNIELRIPAYEAGEEEMIDLFEREDDPPYYGSVHLLMFDTLHPEKFAKHGAECKKVYTSTWYQWTKNGDFAVQYGSIESSGTADRAYHVPGAFARIKGRFRAIHGKGGLNDQMIKFAEEHGYVETIPDKLVCPDRGYPIYCTRSKWGAISPTVPLNYHVQSTACWWMMVAMVVVSEYLQELNAEPGSDGYYMICQIHDELVFDFPKGKTHETNLPKIRRIQRLMEEGGNRIGIPTPVGIEYHGKVWSEGVTIT